MPNGKEPPANIDAEKVFLGSIILNNKLYSKVRDTIDKDMFYKDDHGRIYSAIEELFEANVPVDIVTLADKLKSNGYFEFIGGKNYLEELVKTPFKPDNCEQYARIIEKNYLLRSEIRLLESSLQQIYCREVEDVKSFLEGIAMKTFNIIQKVDRPCMSMHAIIREEFERIEKAFEEKQLVVGLSTGYHALDALVLGFWPGSLWVLGGSSKAGKSTLLLNFAENIASYDKTPYIFSLEMTKEQWMRKRITKAAKVDDRKLRTGYFEKDCWHRLAEAAGALRDSPYLIDDNPSPTLNEIMVKIRRAKEYRDIAFVGIDYIQRIEIPGKTAVGHEKELIKASEALKTLARDLKIPIMFAGQLDESVMHRKDKKPFLSDLNGLERAVDVALLLYRPELYWPEDQEKKGWADLIVYSRFDPEGTVRLATKLEYSLFENLPCQERKKVK